MENIQQTTIFKFGIDDETRNNLKALAQWAKVNAVLGFVSVGLSLLTIIVASIKFLDSYIAGNLVGTLVRKQLLVWIISLVVNIILYKAASNIQAALLHNDQRLFNIGLNLLARYFKIIGIFFIVGVTLMILILIFSLVMNGFQINS